MLEVPYRDRVTVGQQRNYKLQVCVCVCVCLGGGGGGGGGTSWSYFACLDVLKNEYWIFFEVLSDAMMFTGLASYLYKLYYFLALKRSVNKSMSCGLAILVDTQHMHMADRGGILPTLNLKAETFICMENRPSLL